jgi:oxygen-independent coproporphyrinogen III oxidase
MRGLYVHIPFCVKKCSYCDFYSLPSRLDTMEAYVQAVLHEANSFPLSQSGIKGDLQPPEKPYFQTLYIGGGTPSLLGAQKLQTLINGLNYLFVIPAQAGSHIPNSPTRHCEYNEAISGLGGSPYYSVGSGFEPDRPNGSNPSRSLLESTIELNPESATSEFLQMVKNLGFNRLSFGVQSLSDDELKSVGRIHTAAQAVSAIKLAQKLGFKAISADLIIGLPGQTWASLRKSLETLVALGIQHLSVYCLSLEEGTPLAKNPPADLPSDDIQAKLFEETSKYLKTCGYAHYEISNFAMSGYECRHNLNYWRGGDYLGLGPAAASHLDGKRFKNYANLDAYLADPTGQIEYIEELSKKEKAAEEAILRLRLLEEGLNTDELAGKFGENNVKSIISRLDEMVQAGSIEKDRARYRLTPSRIMTSNPIFARVLADEGV